MSGLASVLLPSLAAMLVSAVASELFRRWAIQHGVLDVPNARSLHSTLIPLGGGIGIALGFSAGLAAWLALGGSVPPRAVGWLIGALLLASISFADDLHPRPAVERMLVQLLGAVILTVAGVQGGSVPLELTVPLAFLWVVLVTNVYNFMDGIDGIAALEAVVAGAAFATAGAIVHNPLLGEGGALLAASAIGFLRLNCPVARLFMGDVGSTFLGFSFAALSLLSHLGVGGGQLPLEFGPIVLAPFLLDAIATLAQRVRRGERWYEAHRSHYYQRLVIRGWSHGRVAALYAGLGVLSGLGALADLMVQAPVGYLAAVVGMLPFIAVPLLVRLQEHRGTAESIMGPA